MLASAARTYLNRFAVLPAKKIVVATTNDGTYRTAFDLAAAGAAVTVADMRPAPAAAHLAEAERLGVAVRAGTRVTDLRGSDAVKSARLAGSGGEIDVPCDLVCLSGGWSPSVHLTSHLSAKPAYREDIDGFVPGSFPAGQFGAGSIMGNYTTRDAIEQGHRAGIEAATFCGRSVSVPAPSPLDLGETTTAGFRQVPACGRGKAFIDFQMDVTASDIALAHREGYDSVEHLKRYITLGVGTRARPAILPPSLRSPPCAVQPSPTLALRPFARPSHR
jgi:hypothetical protein